LIQFTDYGKSGCGGYGVLTSSDGFIKSHSNHGAGQYSNNRDCAWDLRAPSGYLKLKTITSE